LYKKLAISFGKIGLKYFSSYFAPLKEEIMKSNLNILFELYVGRMLLFSFLAAGIALIAISIGLMILGFDSLFSVFGGLILSLVTFLVFLTSYHSYPLHLMNSKKNNIEANMPFAINHMAAIASSGVPPFVIFKLISNVHEYGEIANESRRIVRNTEIFGMDIITAIKNVANRTPSDSLRQFLAGITSTIETGGDLKKYLEEAAKDTLFDYSIKREKYTQTLSMYADIYTTVLVAAPLFLVTILSVMSMIFESSIFGMSITTAMKLGTYILIPFLNILFILFIHYTQPKV
jgi:flagellar protein FlaJ